ncbi:MAG: hypothetical protein GQ477_05800 [Nanohaloarchaea archaeon]|nr:hypothetical protein [Candidatus Nanohaloarchaea archaeon]
MPNIGIESLRGDIKIHLDDTANKEYWDMVAPSASAKKKVASLIKSKVDHSFTLDRLYIFIRGGRILKKSKKSSPKPSKNSRKFQKALIPLSYLRAIEESMNVGYAHLEDNIEFYVSGTKSKIIPCLDGVPKLPIDFDQELVLALSSVMWHNQAQNETFGFRASNQKQIEYLYHNFSNHFGEIPLGKGSAENHNLYIAPKVATDIGLSYLDEHFDELDDYYHVAIVLGACAARGKPIPKRIGGEGIAISSLAETPMYRVQSSLDKLGIAYENKTDMVIVSKESTYSLSSLCDGFTELYPKSEQLLSGLNF